MEFKQILDSTSHLPDPKEKSDLFQWYNRQKNLMRRGKLRKVRINRFQELEQMVENAKAREKEKKAEEKRKKTEEKIRLQQNRVAESVKHVSLTTELAVSLSQASPTPPGKDIAHRPFSQDKRWDRMWQAYTDYMNENGCRPSKHHTEDMRLFDWYKHNKKLLNQGKLRPERMEKFRLLLIEAKDVQRVNQHQYVNGTAAPKVIHKKEMKLYGYQMDMKQQIEEAFCTHQSVMAQMPTGTGKTHVVASVIRDFIQDGMGQVWAVAHRQELVSQLKDTLALYLDREEMRRVTVKSIQWLSRHIDDMQTSSPSLIVIDEAHHALAKTYYMLMARFPHAKKLGVTATPYRLSGEGFSVLFEKLVTSWDIRTFIRERYLCPFDYYTMSGSSIELQEIKHLNQHGADGDFLSTEMERRLGTENFIERLFDTYQRFAYGKRGFVYAINIRHAETIAAYYSAHGVKAAAVSSKTPKMEREDVIAAFKRGDITVLCSVDLFSEGFDAPDAEMVQLARPTLSLAKYLQMVGRGLRTAKNKQVCTILDNVGLEKLFGPPDAPRDWKLWFNGFWKEYNLADNAIYGPVDQKLGFHVGPNQDMYLAVGHTRKKENDRLARTYTITTDGQGKQGLADKDGNKILPCVYENIEHGEDGIIILKSRKRGMEWLDTLNGIRYDECPVTDYVGNIPIAVVGIKFYPRLQSRWLHADNFIREEQMKVASGEGIDWQGENTRGIHHHYYIPWNGIPRIYRILSQKKYGARLLEDEYGRQYVQQNPDSPLSEVERTVDVADFFERCKENFVVFSQLSQKHRLVKANVSRLKRNGYLASQDVNGIIKMSDKQGHNADFWVDSLTGRAFNTEPQAFMRGSLKLLRVGNFVYLRNKNYPYPYQDWQIKADDKRFWIMNKEFEV